MAKYVSGRQKNLKVGISSYSENLTSIEVIGNVGIATTNATSKLYVVGDGYFTGIVTASNLNFGNSLVGAAGSFSQLNVSGITTLGITSTTNLTSQQLNVSGITTLGVTSTTNLTSQQLNVSGITTLGITSTTNLTSQQLNVSGITTLGITSTTNLTSRQLNVSGITTLGITSATNLTSQQLNVSGITTLGITSTTNLTAQQLNVSGITTLGIVTSGNIYSTGVVTATQFSTGSGTLGFTTNTINGPSEIIIDPSPVGVGTTSGAVRIRGDLYVDGTQFIVNSTTIELADFNVGIATTVGTNILLDGAGIGIGSVNIRKTFTYNNISDSLKSSENLDIASGKVYKIGGTEVLSSTQLTVANINATGISTFNGNVYVPSSSVGIGTTNPLQRLQIGTANTLGINTTGTVFVVTSNADVGIGTTNPIAKLHVIGDGRFTGVITATTFSGTLSGFASTAGVSTSVIGGIASVTQLTVSGITTFNNNVYVPSSSVGIGTTNPLQRLQIGTANTLGINTTGTVFVVTSNADVGIGTTNPIAKLHVVGDVLIVGVSTLGVTSTTNLTSQQLNVSGISTLQSTTLIGGGTSTGTAGQVLQVSGINSSVYIGGNLGIGTTNPTSKLWVNGDVRISGVVTATLFSGTLSGIASVTQLNVSGISTLTTLSVGGTTGINGQYLKSTGTGLVWASFTSLRNNYSYTSTEGQKQFVASGINTGYVDVFLNGIRLDETNYSITGTGVSLGVGAYDQDEITIVGFNTLNAGGASSQTLDQTLSFGNSSSLGMSIGVITATDYRIQSVAEKTTLVNGNNVSLVYNTGGGNVAICTNPSGNITLNVTGIPTASTFDNYSLAFSVIVTNTGTARSCTAINLNGVSKSILWFGGSLAAAISGVTTSNGYDVYSFTGINTLGSASTTSNYIVLGSVNGSYR